MGMMSGWMWKKMMNNVNEILYLIICIFDWSRFIIIDL